MNNKTKRRKAQELSRLTFMSFPWQNNHHLDLKRQPRRAHRKLPADLIVGGHLE
jgi:hypothetical protein